MSLRLVTTMDVYIQNTIYKYGFQEIRFAKSTNLLMMQMMEGRTEITRGGTDKIIKISLEFSSENKYKKRDCSEDYHIRI